jgi:hypothetical protein
MDVDVMKSCRMIFGREETRLGVMKMYCGLAEMILITQENIIIRPEHLAKVYPVGGESFGNVVGSGLDAMEEASRLMGVWHSTWGVVLCNFDQFM